MLKKRLSWIFSVFLLISIAVFPGDILAADRQAFNLTAEEKAEDVEALMQFISENCPYLPVMEEADRRWYNRKGEFLQLIRETKNDLEYYQTLNRILQVLGNGHTNVVSPDYYSYLQGLPLSRPWQQVLQQDEVSRAYRRWADILEGDQLRPSFLARYIDGGYYVLDSAFPGLPEGAQITAVNGLGVDRFVLENSSSLYRDPLRDKEYSRFLPVPAGELKLDYIYQDRSAEVVVRGRIAGEKGVKTTTPPAEDNISTRILEKDRAAYLRVRSFGYQHLAADRGRIQSFLEEIKNYPYLIIDIRGNGGGDDSYWQELLVSPLIEQPLLASFYVFYRSGDYLQPFVSSTVGPGKAFLRVGRNTLLKRMSLPAGLLSADYMDPLKLPYLISPQNQVGFRGDIILLVDNLVYSSAESLAAFARATGWALLAGTKTGGDGIGFTPIEFMLPNSKLLVRLPMTVGLNPDGSINTAGQTAPDIYLDYQPGDYLKIWNREMQSGEDNMVQELLSLIDSGGLAPVEIRTGSLLADFFRDYDGDYGYPVEKELAEFDGMIIDSIRIAGGFKTDKELLRRIIGLRAGDRFSTEAVRLAGERLQVFNAHTSTSIDVKKIGVNRVELTAFIQEGVGFALSPVSLSYNLVEDIINNRISYTHHNLGGKMVNLKGVFGLGPGKERNLTLTGPFFPGIPTKAALSFGSYKDLRRVRRGEHRGSSYLIDSKFISLADLILVGNGFELTPGLKYIRERVEKLESTGGLLLEDSDYLDGTITLEKGIYDLAGGVLMELTGKGLYPHVKLAAAGEMGLTERFSLYLRGEAGWKDGETPLNHCFFPGGKGSFAAYSSGSLVGNRYLSAGMELRRYFNQDLYLALLADGGMVWQPGESIRFSPPLSGVGLAARYRTPVGLVLEGLYAADPFREGQQRFSFGLDTEF